MYNFWSLKSFIASKNYIINLKRLKMYLQYALTYSTKPHFYIPAVY